MKKLNPLWLVLLSQSAVADQYTVVGVDENGQPLNNCDSVNVSSPITYTDLNCRITMNLVAGGQPLTVDLGTCPANHKIKVIIDDYMYKFNANIDTYSDLIDSLDVISLNAALENCSGNGTTLSDLELFSQTEILDLDESFGIRWGVDSNDKPLVHMRSLSGDVICDGATLVNVSSNDFIFEDGFDE